MTFDLFGEGTPTPALPPIAPTESFVMQPTGVANEWRYRDVLLICDMRLLGFIGHWQTTEALGDAIAKSDTRVSLCKRIDVHLGPWSNQ